MGECEHIRRRLADYAVGGLSRRARARVTAHVEACASCRAELRALEHTGALLQTVGMEAAPDDWEMVRARIRARARKAARPVLRLAWAAGMATVGLILLVYGGVLRSPQDSGLAPETAAVVEAETELRATMEDHLTAVWASPLADEASVGLRLAALEEEG